MKNIKLNGVELNLTPKQEAQDTINHCKEDYKLLLGVGVGMKKSELKFGDVVRVKCTAIGRYLGNGKALFVGAMDNDLYEDDIKYPIDTSNKYKLPLPSDKELKKHQSLTIFCKSCGQKKTL